MCQILRKNLVWLSFLKELVDRQIITELEKVKLVDIFGDTLSFKNINLEERTNILDQIICSLGQVVAELEHEAFVIHNENLKRVGSRNLTNSWMLAELYAHENNRSIFQYVHSLMTIYIQK